MKSINLKFVFVFLLSIAMVFSLSACGADSDADDSGGSDAAATEAPAGGDIVAAFPFNNTGTEEVCELYLSPTGQEDWGNDQLNGQTIAAGASFTLTDIPAGNYDIKAVWCNGADATAENVSIQN